MSTVTEILSGARFQDWGVPIHFETSWTQEDLRVWVRVFEQRYGTIQILDETHSHVFVRSIFQDYSIQLTGGSLPVENSAIHNICRLNNSGPAFAEFILINPYLDERVVLLNVFHELGHHQYFADHFAEMAYADRPERKAESEPYAILYSFNALYERGMGECIRIQILEIESKLANQTAGSYYDAYTSLVLLPEWVEWRIRVGLT